MNGAVCERWASYRRCALARYRRHAQCHRRSAGTGKHRQPDRPWIVAVRRRSSWRAAARVRRCHDVICHRVPGPDEVRSRPNANQVSTRAVPSPLLDVLAVAVAVAEEPEVEDVDCCERARSSRWRTDAARSDDSESIAGHRRASWSHDNSSARSRAARGACRARGLRARSRSAGWARGGQWCPLLSSMSSSMNDPGLDRCLEPRWRMCGDRGRSASARLSSGAHAYAVPGSLERVGSARRTGDGAPADLAGGSGRHRQDEARPRIRTREAGLARRQHPLRHAGRSHGTGRRRRPRGTQRRSRLGRGAALRLGRPCTSDRARQLRTGARRGRRARPVAHRDRPHDSRAGHHPHPVGTPRGTGRHGRSARHAGGRRPGPRPVVPDGAAVRRSTRSVRAPCPSSTTTTVARHRPAGPTARRHAAGHRAGSRTDPRAQPTRRSRSCSTTNSACCTDRTAASTGTTACVR